MRAQRWIKAIPSDHEPDTTAGAQRECEGLAAHFESQHSMVPLGALGHERVESERTQRRHRLGRETVATRLWTRIAFNASTDLSAALASSIDEQDRPASLRQRDSTRAPSRTRADDERVPLR